MHDFFKFSPTKHIIRATNALLTNRVKPIVYTSEEQEEEKKQQEPAHVVTENALPSGINDHQSASSADPKLSEVNKLLPHLLLCLDYKVAQKTMKCFQNMMIYGDLSMRISLVDQMIYFIKELMMDAPENHLIAQYL